MEICGTDTGFCDTAVRMKFPDRICRRPFCAAVSRKGERTVMSSSDYRYITRLAVRVQAGDSNAFAELYAATCQQQYRFSCRYLNNTALAQDALKEIYTEALKNIAKLNEPSLIIAWLNQINFRICYEFQKKYRLHRLRVIDLNQAGDTDSLAGDVFHDDRFDDLFSTESSREYLMNQILKLPFSEAQVVILWHFHHMKYGEIAQLMNIRRSSVKRHLAEGRKRLEKILRQI